MAERLFVGSKHVQCAGSGSGSIQQEVSSKNTLIVERIFITSTGAFAITNIQDNFGNRFTDADATAYIEGSTFNDSASDNNTPADLPFPITIEGNGSLTFDFLDTSTSTNDIRVILMGKLIT